MIPKSGHATGTLSILTWTIRKVTFPYLYYGASPEEVDVLLENGIFPIKQRYVHLSTSYEKAAEVALIHTENPVIIQIDALRAQEDGISLKLATDYIVLAEKIPPEYLFVVED